MVRLTVHKLPWAAPFLLCPRGKGRRDTKSHARWGVFASPVSGKHLEQAASCKDRSGKKVPKPIPGFKEMKGLGHAALWEGF